MSASPDPGRGRVAPVACLALLAALAGCATRAEPPAGDSPARTPVDPAVQARVDHCNELLRDVRSWCREGLRGDEPLSRFECLDARMKLDKDCLTPR